MAKKPSNLPIYGIIGFTLFLGGILVDMLVNTDHSLVAKLGYLTGIVQK